MTEQAQTRKARSRQAMKTALDTTGLFDTVWIGTAIESRGKMGPRKLKRIVLAAVQVGEVGLPSCCGEDEEVTMGVACGSGMRSVGLKSTAMPCAGGGNDGGDDGDGGGEVERESVMSMAVCGSGGGGAMDMVLEDVKRVEENGRLSKLCR